MKWSRYNYIYKSQVHNTHLLYNSLTNSFIKLDNKDVLTAINCIKDNINEFDVINNQEFYDQLKKSKIITESDDVEAMKIKNHILQNRYSPFTLILTVLPTIACNFKCPYCWENNEKGIFMSEEVENSIIKYIQNSTQNLKNSLLNLCWMGGEPLLNFKRIKSITKKIKECNINLNAQMVTNGYLLTEEKIKDIENLNISQIQITIDGVEAIHNKTRIHKSKHETFSKIISNIETFFKFYPNSETLSINIRVNLNKNENYINKFIDIHNFLRDKFPYKNLYISPGFIEDMSSNGHNAGCVFDRSLMKEFFLEITQEYNLKEFSPYPNNKLIECAVRSGTNATIGPSGELYICWENIGKGSKIIGQITETGILKITDEDSYTKYLMGADYLNDPKCLECFFFPICNGGCPEKRIRNLYEGAAFDCCCLHKNNIEEILNCHYKIKLSTKAK